MTLSLTRREFTGSASLVLVSNGASADEKRPRSAPISPTEDLMREHGVLNRVLLVYEAAIEKLSKSQDFDPSVLAQAADIVRSFIEGYHERNEEQQLFPRFRRAGVFTDLVDVLYQQHQAGRRLTDTILDLISSNFQRGEDRQILIANLHSFIAMYRPHEAREDTELFPKLHQIVSPNEFDALGEDFEREERRRFGEDGFASVVARLDSIETAFDIHDLGKSTPQ